MAETVGWNTQEIMTSKRKANCTCDAELANLLNLVADIRCAVGDREGKLMQDELVERCRRLADSQSSSLNRLAAEIHRGNHKWWHDANGVRLQRNKGELLCLIHSEISEAMEGERKDLMDDKLPHRKMAEVELADALIRILDYAAGYGYDIGGAVAEKLSFNATRKDHTHEARAAKNGKKF